jgi:preprotein translocase subunit YajC
MTNQPVFLSILAAQQPAPNPGAGMTALLFQMVVIFGLAYLLFLRPQQKARKAHEERIKQLKRGDEIVTAGGIIGEVVHVAQETKDGKPAPALEDRITIKSGESRLIIERGRIQRLITATAVTEEKQK